MMLTVSAQAGSWETANQSAKYEEASWHGIGATFDISQRVSFGYSSAILYRIVCT
jgi:hypothetical protein